MNMERDRETAKNTEGPRRTSIRPRKMPDPTPRTQQRQLDGKNVDWSFGRVPELRGRLHRDGRSKAHRRATRERQISHGTGKKYDKHSPGVHSTVPSLTTSTEPI